MVKGGGVGRGWRVGSDRRGGGMQGQAGLEDSQARLDKGGKALKEEESAHKPSQPFRVTKGQGQDKVTYLFLGFLGS